MATEKEIVSSMITAFNRRDIDGIMEFFTEDSVYHNLPMKPVTGLRAIRELIEYFVNPAQELDWEILNIAATGSLVFAERADRFVIDGKKIELPVVGVFEIYEDKISAWRDYFDMATWQRQTTRQ